MTSATIFVNDRAWLNGELCVGVRFDTQILPSGSRVVGFLTEDGGETLAPPYIADPAQDGAFEYAVHQAKEVLAGRKSRVEGL